MKEDFFHTLEEMVSAEIRAETDKSLFGIDATTYDMWKGKKVNANGVLTMKHISDLYNRLVSSEVERVTLNDEVIGSTPIPNTTYIKNVDIEAPTRTGFKKYEPLAIVDNKVMTFDGNEYYFKTFPAAEVQPVTITNTGANGWVHFDLPKQEWQKPMRDIEVAFDDPHGPVILNNTGAEDIWGGPLPFDEEPWDQPESKIKKQRILEIFNTKQEAKEAFKIQIQYPNFTSRHGEMIAYNDTVEFHFRSLDVGVERLQGCSFHEIYCPEKIKGTDIYNHVLVPSTTLNKGKITFR